MEIIDILQEKRESLLESGNPLSIHFLTCEIRILSDPIQLRGLKMMYPFPEDFISSSNLFACADSIMKGDSIYRILELCLLINRVLIPNITSVFKKMAA